MHGFRYLLTIVDDFSRYTWTIPMCTKSEVRTHIATFLSYIENHFQTTVKIIRSDNGVEFAMTTFFSSKGIIHKKTCIKTPEQNGIVERKHQHILNVTRALLFQAHLPPIFWHFAVLHVVLLINCIPTPLLHNMTPYEKLHGSLYDISSLRVFGCLCYSSTITSHRKKLDDRYVFGIFLGFQPHTKGYLFLNLQNHKIEISRHTIFYENHFPYKLKDDNTKSPNNLSLPIPQSYNFSYDFLSDNPNTTAEIMSDNPNTAAKIIVPTENMDHEQPRRSTRIRRTPAYLEEFHTNLPSAHAVSSKYPIHKFVSYHKLSSKFKNTISSFSSSTEPHNYEDVAEHECWKKAMADELAALHANNTWILYLFPQAKRPLNVVGCTR